jgi:hypothetical protein
MKITKAILRERVDRLNLILNRPRDTWSPDAPEKPHKSNDGHFFLDTYTPGDGWTRYTLSVIVGSGGGQMNVSPGCTAQEMHAYLRGVFDMLDSVFMCDGGKHTFDKWAKSKAVQS